MKLHYFKLLFILLIVSRSKTFAQADISMATHWYNRANYNPASITKSDYTYLFSNVRQQWTGVDGAPTVFNIQASQYIHGMHSAFGISLVSDQVGVTQAINPMLSYAYRIDNGLDWTLSMGLSAGVFSRSINGFLYEAETISDASISYEYEKTIKPDANFGVEFQCTHFIFGLSSTHLFSIANDSTILLNTNHRYGYVIYKNIDSELFNYNCGIQMVNRNNLTIMEGNASIRFKHPTGLTTGPREIFDLGITYRTSKQLTLLLGLNLSNNFRIGYAYDQTFSVGYSANPTHEIMLEYRIPSKAASDNNYRNNQFWYY